MNVYEMAIQDIKAFTSGDAGKELIFTAPTGETATVNGVNVKHWNSENTDGEKVNAKTASFSVNEALLTAQNYPVRNSYGSVDFKGHKVAIKDGNGTLCIYAIDEWYPDEAVQLITCMIGDFE